jgi:predicted RNA-binding protein
MGRQKSVGEWRKEGRGKKYKTSNEKKRSAGCGNVDGGFEAGRRRKRRREREYKGLRRA